MIIERISFTTSLDNYLSLPALSAYSSLSERTLRDAIAAPVNALPAYRFGARVVVRRSDFDRWALSRRKVGQPVEGRIDRRRAKLRRVPAA